MAVLEKRFGCELLKPVQIANIPKITINNTDTLKISVNVMNNGEPFTLGGTIKGYLVRADKTTVSYSGSRSANAASVSFPVSALRPGAFFFTLVNIDGISTTTIAAVSSVAIA